MSADAEELIARSGGKRRRGWVRGLQWSAAIFVALAVHGSALIFISLPKDHETAGRRMSAPVTLRAVNPEEGGQLLREQLEFSDTAPLYFPTDWNVANAENLVVPQETPGDIFEPYQPRLGFSRVDARSLAAFPEAVMTGPVNALAGFRSDTTRLVGRIDRVETIPQERIAMVEVFDVKDGTRVFESTVRDVSEGSALSGVDWNPAEWVVLMDAVGGIGGAMMTRSSGSDAVDRELQILVDGELGLDKQLNPGYYVVILGP